MLDNSGSFLEVFGLVVIPLDLSGIGRRMANTALLIAVAIFPPKGSSAGPAGPGIDKAGPYRGGFEVRFREGVRNGFDVFGCPDLSVHHGMLETIDKLYPGRAFPFGVIFFLFPGTIRIQIGVG